MGGLNPLYPPKVLPPTHCTKKHRLIRFLRKDFMRVKRNCAICGTEYWTSNGKSKYCSYACRKVAAKDRAKRFNDAHPNYHAEKLREWQQRHKNENN